MHSYKYNLIIFKQLSSSKVIFSHELRTKVSKVFNFKIKIFLILTFFNINYFNDFK